MRTIILIAALSSAACLSACNKVPSCGDTAATENVSQLMKNAVVQNTNDLADDIKAHLNVSIEQAIVVSKNESTSSVSCKAIAKFKIEPSMMTSLARLTNDKERVEIVGKKFRQLIGLESPADILAVTEKIEAAEASHDPKLEDYKNQQRQMLRVDGNASVTEMGLQLMRISAQRPAELQKNAELLQSTIGSIDSGSNSINLDITYTIEKIDGGNGENPFKFNVTYKHDAIEGIQLLEVWNLADLYIEKESKDVKTAATPATPASVSATVVATAPTIAEAPTPVSTTVATQMASIPTAPPAVATTPDKSVAPISSQAPVASNSARGKIEASFDCTKASTAIEKMICSTPESATADKNLAITYNAVKSKMGANAGQYKAEQIKWMKEVRNACPDVACLVKVTNARGEQLALESD